MPNLPKNLHQYLPVDLQMRSQRTSFQDTTQVALTNLLLHWKRLYKINPLHKTSFHNSFLNPPAALLQLCYQRNCSHHSGILPRLIKWLYLFNEPSLPTNKAMTICHAQISVVTESSPSNKKGYFPSLPHPIDKSHGPACLLYCKVNGRTSWFAQ